MQHFIYTDDQVIKSLKNFIVKFECATNQIISANGILYIEPHMYPITKTERFYYFNKINIVNTKRYNPIDIMMQNKIVKLTDSWIDSICEYFKLPRLSVSAFIEGSTNNSGYRDVYTTHHWAASAMFNLGRHYMLKYHSINLPYKISEKISHLIK